MTSRTWLARIGVVLWPTCVFLLAGAGSVRAGDNDAELRALVEEQARKIAEQKQKIAEVKALLDQAGAGTPAPRGEAASKQPAPDEDAVKKIVGDYLKDNPGAGMPASVQTGYQVGQGFVIRSTPSPSYLKWDDESRVPFELRLHGRLQLDYYFYKVTDDANHQTGAHQQSQNANSHRFADFSQLEVKRCDIIVDGNAFSPDLRYFIDLDGTTRGINGFQNNKVIQNSGSFDPNGSAISPIGGNVAVDHIVRLRYGYVAYDLRGCAAEHGCGPDCPDSGSRYAPTYTLIAGKLNPFFGLEQYLSTTDEQFVEYSMANWFFNADDNNKLMAAGTQIKACDDRFYLQAIVTNGNEAQFPNTQMDELPGFVMGLWYDLGGEWNATRKRWDLFGDSLADIDWSCKPVVRLGGSLNLVPMDRRSLYGDDEPSRVFVTPGGGPNGTRLINLLNGGGVSTATTLRGAHAVDTFDSYSYNVFAAGKWHGISLSNEWWVRDLTGFKAAPNGGDVILYTYTDPKKGTVNALFPDKALLDYGSQLQAGYFLIPHKLEVVARWSWVRGDSGDVLGDIRQTPTVFNISSGVPGAATSRGGQTRVQVNPGAFSNFHEADEYAIGINWYFRRELLKWQTDLSLYQGGNPAGGGQSAAGFIAGEDGWLLRTQIQLAF
jgi:hypothetical protein